MKRPQSNTQDIHYAKNIKFNSQDNQITFLLFKDNKIGFNSYLGNQIINKDYDNDNTSDDDINKATDRCNVDLDFAINCAKKYGLNVIIKLYDLRYINNDIFNLLID